MAVDDDAGADERRARRRERAVITTLAAVQFTSIVDFMLVMPLGPQLMRRMAIDPERFGMIVSSYTLSAGLAGLVASSLVDRFDRKRAFLFLYAGFLVGTLACGLSTSYTALVAARVATGAFGGVLGGMAFAIIGDVFPEERRGRATGSLMSAFALASVVGVPFGLYLGTKFGWQWPFLLLAALGVPTFFLGMRGLPTLRGHLARQGKVDPLGELFRTMSHPNHIRAFLLVTSLMLGSFSVIPYISPYLVANVGVMELDLPWVYVAGGVLTLVAAPIIGRLADRHGKLAVYRVVAPVSMVMLLAITNLPRVGLAVAVGAVGLLMVSNAGRMIAAMAMVTASVEPSRRGGFMSANSAVQHLASGVAASVGGWILVERPDRSLAHFGRVGLFAAGFTLLSMWLAGRLRIADDPGRASPELAMVAAEEAMGDATSPIPVGEAG